MGTVLRQPSLDGLRSRARARLPRLGGRRGAPGHVRRAREYALRAPPDAGFERRPDRRRADRCRCRRHPRNTHGQRGGRPSGLGRTGRGDLRGTRAYLFIQ